MRTILLLFVLFIHTYGALQAQTFSPLAGNAVIPRHSSLLNTCPPADSNLLSQKWSLSRYGGFSAGYTFFNGGGAKIFSAPVGLQLNRRLNNNLFAFAGVSVAPAYINFNSPYPAYNKGGSVGRYSGTGQLNIYSRAELGLMYVNDQKTFSISGSIGIERSSYPFYPAGAYYRQPAPSIGR